MMKRFFITALAIMVCLGVIMTGCGTQNDSNNGETQSTTTQKTSETAKVTEQTEPKLEPAKLIWYLRCDTPKNAESVVNKANELISKEINATVDFKFVTPGEYNDKMQLVMQSSEEYDLCYTASWSNNYTNNVSRGAYIPLDDYIAKYPDIKALVPDPYWDAIKINGNAYAVPNLQVMYTQMGLWFRKDLVEKYGIDINNIKQTSDLTTIYQKIKDNEPDMYCLSEPVPHLYFIKYRPTIELDIAVDDNWKVYDSYETDYLENFKIMREWYKKGFMPSDASTLKDHISLVKAGKVFSRFTTIKPGGEADLKSTYGFDVVQVAIAEPVVQRTSVLATLTAVSVTSKNPERAMMLLNLMNTNKEIYNTMVFGIENQDYKKAGPNRVETIPDTYVTYAWQLGNQFNAYVKDAQPDDVWEQTKKLNAEATVGKMTGFSFDKKNVENEYAQASAINKEFDKILHYGLDDAEKALQKRADKLKAAKFDTLLKEMQAQVDAWVKENIK